MDVNSFIELGCKCWQDPGACPKTVAKTAAWWASKTAAWWAYSTFMADGLYTASNAMPKLGLWAAGNILYAVDGTVKRILSSVVCDIGEKCSYLPDPKIYKNVSNVYHFIAGYFNQADEWVTSMAGLSAPEKSFRISKLIMPAVVVYHLNKWGSQYSASAWKAGMKLLPHGKEHLSVVDIVSPHFQMAAVDQDRRQFKDLALDFASNAGKAALCHIFNVATSYGIINALVNEAGVEETHANRLLIAANVAMVALPWLRHKVKAFYATSPDLPTLIEMLKPSRSAGDEAKDLIVQRKVDVHFDLEKGYQFVDSETISDPHGPLSALEYETIERKISSDPYGMLPEVEAQ